MKKSTSRSLVALALGAALVLTGCSSSDDKAKDNNEAVAGQGPEGATPDAATALQDIKTLKSVKVKGEPGEAPALEFDTPLTVTDTAALVIDAGDGEEIKAGDTISFHSVAYSGSTGEILEGSDSFGKDPEAQPLDPGQVAPALLDVLIGEKVGTRFLLANPVMQEGDSVIVALEVIGTKETPKPLDRAVGEAVTPEDGLPTVTLDDTGKPSIDIPKGYGAPDGLVTQPLIKGDGDVVEASNTIVADYTGWKLDGEVFDSSWERGEPSTFPLGGVIEGWTEGLSGQTVGSQVLLVIPPELAYGDDGDLAGETLIFVVDILAVS